MKSQINLLNQLQELVLTRDEHHHTGDGSHMEALDASIGALVDKLEPQPKALYQRLYKKDHVVMAPMVNGCCAVCGMKLPISQVQQVRLAKTLQTCSSCGRIVYDEQEDAPRSVAEKPARGEPRKTGIGRFSAEELMVCELKAERPEDAVRELADQMAANKFVSNPAALTVAAMERESVLSTAMGEDLAFPHVRGVEGGGLTLALGVSKKGIAWDASTGETAHLVFFSVIPVAVSAFYLRLMAGLMEAFSKKENRDALLAAKTQGELWKAFMKATRYTIR
ncbi:MAG: PTS sugar transporter subunit IIA [Kiritimatiellae bacterium]|nr:PTS sugar transporter subunit IIA [Kiritimatiellia bacterium]